MALQAKMMANPNSPDFGAWQAEADRLAAALVAALRKGNRRANRRA